MSSRLPRSNNLELANQNSSFCLCRRVPKRALNADEAWVGRGTVVYGVKPVALAHSAGLDPFVGRDLDVALLCSANCKLPPHGPDVARRDVPVADILLMDRIQRSLFQRKDVHDEAGNIGHCYHHSMGFETKPFSSFN